MSKAESCGNIVTCKEPGTMCCNACRAMYYCSAICQKQHWSQHKAACKVQRNKRQSDACLKVLQVQTPLCSTKEGHELLLETVKDLNNFEFYDTKLMIDALIDVLMKSIRSYQPIELSKFVVMAMLIGAKKKECRSRFVRYEVGKQLCDFLKEFKVICSQLTDIDSDIGIEAATVVETTVSILNQIGKETLQPPNLYSLNVICGLLPYYFDLFCTPTASNMVFGISLPLMDIASEFVTPQGIMINSGCIEAVLRGIANSPANLMSFGPALTAIQGLSLDLGTVNGKFGMCPNKNAYTRLLSNNVCGVLMTRLRNILQWCDKYDKNLTIFMNIDNGKISSKTIPALTELAKFSTNPKSLLSPKELIGQLSLGAYNGLKEFLRFLTYLTEFSTQARQQFLELGLLSFLDRLFFAVGLLIPAHTILDHEYDYSFDIYATIENLTCISDEAKDLLKRCETRIIQDGGTTPSSNGGSKANKGGSGGGERGRNVMLKYHKKGKVLGADFGGMEDTPRDHSSMAAYLHDMRSGALPLGPGQDGTTVDKDELFRMMDDHFKQDTCTIA